MPVWASHSTVHFSEVLKGETRSKQGVPITGHVIQCDISVSGFEVLKGGDPEQGGGTHTGHVIQCDLSVSGFEVHSKEGVPILGM